ncbi:hypothetical protein GobsT_71700 [Gemmata obscuriglobus]|uniref:Uncharacterized protein n=1 Tax=Gemmata obscuriglobus TaxID=114 RepID=A0A2Z3HDR6_9BACT|nr:hypothetical protein [Gemmata obscuriglobus]AWM41737.1 hypothetical protein C1280_35230 [Gemmata obscuriglobus]QEG32315.1 hypothetical protein GobsT_71700 [Gemmata obscuriglobus]VTS11671.1 Uncharacterized protein OS=Singulisphaera acidiphila (strain ATCC BAA-1392 / DSM 18658 / VKM B-2454 / MOB10) GN=Sinac_0157 PE=4 SV=1 [Gemmata obscuriglobus UQM 2246]
MSQQPSSAALTERAGELKVCPSHEKSGWREEGIRARVLAALGRPAGLLQVSVKNLWGNNFRVNVWAGGSAGAAIPNSYFVTATEDGTIVRAEPPIQRQY